MTAQIIGTVLITAAVCGLAAFAALLCQAGRHCDDRAELLRGQLDAYRAGQASVLVQWQEPEDEWPGPEWWDRQFEGITSELGGDGGEGS